MVSIRFLTLSISFLTSSVKEAEAAEVFSTASKPWAPATPAPVCSEELFASFFEVRRRVQVGFYPGYFSFLVTFTWKDEIQPGTFRAGPWITLQRHAGPRCPLFIALIFLEQICIDELPVDDRPEL